MYLHKMHCLDISDVIKQNSYNRKNVKPGLQWAWGNRPRLSLSHVIHKVQQ